MFEILATVGESVGSIVTNTAEILAFIGVIAGVITAHMKAGKARDEVNAVGQYSTAMGQKAIENKGLAKALAEIAIADLPEDKKQEAIALLSKVDESIKVAVAQEQTLKANIPTDARADTNESLPRESFDTKALAKTPRPSPSSSTDTTTPVDTDT